MRIIDVVPRSEAWERLRNRPTASEFGQFVTPARGDYSKQATAYAAKVVAKRLEVYVEPPPSYWMEWGMENEPLAIEAYEAMTGNEVVPAGFILPDETDAYGGSPDGLVGNDGILEVKCPAPETLISYHATGDLPTQYKPQVQGLLMISGREWCDFFAWHPVVKPFITRVQPDPKYQAKIAAGLLMLFEEITRIEERLVWEPNTNWLMT